MEERIKELCLRAAKAVKVPVNDLGRVLIIEKGVGKLADELIERKKGTGLAFWEPHLSDIDSMLLVNELCLNVAVSLHGHTTVVHQQGNDEPKVFVKYHYPPHNKSREEATRMAILEAAADIGFWER